MGPGYGLAQGYFTMSPTLASLVWVRLLPAPFQGHTTAGIDSWLRQPQSESQPTRTGFHSGMTCLMVFDECYSSREERQLIG